MSRVGGLAAVAPRGLSAPLFVARSAARRGSAAVAASTVAIAALGWLVFVIVAHELGPDGYARFSVLWGFTFAVAGVLSGLQQETTRAVSSAASAGEGSAAAPRSETVAGQRVLHSALVLGLAAALLLLVTSPAWAPSVMGGFDLGGVAAVALGVALLAVFLSIRGVLAATGTWTPFSWLGGADAAVRCAAVSLACVWTASATGLLWGIVAGWAVWVAFLPWPAVRASLQVRDRLPLRESLRRASSAMLATGCTALLVAGFPFLARVTSGHGLGPTAGVLFAAVLATRTPLTLPLNGYQLMILRHLVSRRGSLRQALLPLLVGVALVTLVGMGLAVLVGPAVLRTFFGSDFDATAQLLAALVAAAGLLTGMSLTGFAALAADRHTVYTAGWVVATAATVGLLLLPMSLTDRSLLALLVAPVVGATVHVFALRTRRQPGVEGGSRA